MTDYPYMVSNNKIAPIIAGIQAAAKPQKVSREFLKNIGFTSSNDRAIIPLFRKLGFITEDSVPTMYYDQLRDKTQYKRILAARIRELYADLFAINTTIQSDTDENIKGAISRVTGGDEKSVLRVFSTFKALCAIADFDAHKVETPPKETLSTPPVVDTNTTSSVPVGSTMRGNAEFHYNIQIHLPATTDISVYNAIFKSLKDNLLI